MKTRNLILLFALIGLMLNGCVKDEVFQGPPQVSELTLTPQAPSENQSVTVSVKVTDMVGVKSVSLFYKAGDAAMTEVAMTGSGTTYTASIPGQASDVTVNLYVLATNTGGKETYHPEGAPTVTASYTVGAPLIVMNEIYSRGTPEDPDWIEIYNDSDAPVDISGYTVYDSGGQSGAKPKLAFPAGSMIPAKGFLVIVTDGTEEGSFGISSGGEELWFENANGNLIDNVQCPAMEVTQSYGRNPDGSNNWGLLNTITKGAPNSTGEPVAIIKINEVYSKGTVENPDWVELYNASAFEANIGGYKIYDSGGQSGSKPKMEIPAGTTIAANSWYVIVVDVDTETGFGLSSGGEEVWLENAAGSIIDDVIFPAMEDGQSYGRYPDGDDNMQVLYVPTPGAMNDNSMPPAAGMAVMNEVYSRGTAENPDWVELYNNGETAVDLTGYKIYDSGGQSGSKPKKAIPDGTTLEPGAFYVIVVDDDDPSGFGLSSGGEKVWFENAEGMVVDSVEFPAMEEGQSYGRYPDGSELWQLLFIPTPGDMNDNSMPPAAGIALMNEIYSRGTAENPDWVEIFNNGEGAINLTGYKIYDSGGQSGSKPKKVFPDGTIIEPGAFYVIVVDDDDPSGFGLSSGGEKVWFENAEGMVVDSVEFPAMEDTQSYGRFPDGNENWQILNTVTPGAANDDTTPPTPTVVMNEAYSRGDVDNPDWVEIYNPSSSEIDLTGYKIYDSGGQSGTKPKKEFPSGTIIPANGFYVIVVDDDDPSGFGLSSSGDEVWLETPDGTVIDNIAFGALDVTQSYGRKPDGSANLVIFTEVTRGSSNNDAPVLP